MQAFIGMIALFGFNFAPREWAFCSGSILPIAQNTALFSLLGTTYGGDGRTTFGLPDLRGRAPIHFGQAPGLSPIRLGQTKGAESSTLTINQLAPHSHGVTLSAATGPATTGAPAAGDYLAAVTETTKGAVFTYVSGTPPPSPTIDLGGTAAANTGGGQAFQIRGPELAVNFSIAMQGIFPSRN